MQDTSPKGKKELPPGQNSTVLFITIADTTWRMFVPGVGGTLLGVWLDDKLETTPWLMFAGIIAGLCLAAFAVRLQLKKLW